MGVYPRNKTNVCTLLEDVKPNTMQKWVWPFIEGSTELSNSVVSVLLDCFVLLATTHTPLQIVFKNRKKKDTGNNCLLSINDTDKCNMLPTCNKFYPKKSKKSVLRYKIGLFIKTGDVYWVNGGYLPGKQNNDMIFQDTRMHELEEGRAYQDGHGVPT